MEAEILSSLKNSDYETSFLQKNGKSDSTSLNKSYNADDFEEIKLKALLEKEGETHDYGEGIGEEEYINFDLYSEDEKFDEPLDVLDIIDSIFVKIIQESVEALRSERQIRPRRIILAAKELVIKHFSHCFTYPKRPHGEKDYLLSDMELCAEQICFIEKTLKDFIKFVCDWFKPYETCSKVCFKQFASYGRTNTVFAKLEKLKVICIKSVLCCFYKYREPYLDSYNKYKEGFDPFPIMKNNLINAKTALLRSRNFSDEEIGVCLKKIDKYLDYIALMKTKKLRDCPILDNLSDEECVLKFRFRKKHIKVMARLFGLEAVVALKRKNLLLLSSGSLVQNERILTVNCDPIVQLMIYLTRQAHATSLHLEEQFFKFKKTKINDIERVVCQQIYEKFSHLLSIDNCKYSDLYMKMLHTKSLLNPAVVKKNTCYLIDGTHIKISKPKRNNQETVDVTYNGSKASDTLSFQMVTDLFGLFIDVGKAQVGSYDDMRLFRESKICKRMSKLVYNGQKLRMLGDDGYVNNGDVGTDQLDFVINKGDAITETQKQIQRGQSVVRSSIERSFGLLKSLMKACDTKFRNRVYLSDIPTQIVVNCLLMNAHQILYKTTTSGVLSNILPLEVYFLLWGDGCSKILHDSDKKKVSFDQALALDALKICTQAE
ncbi:hypothetical protein QEN19_001329 [Hanseniaspora menglaensis]